jgi:hypothetical protein
MNPFVFVVGCPRSGTTLLQRLLDAHSRLAVIDETLWIPTIFERRKGLTPEGLVTPALIPLLAGHRRFAKLNLPVEQLERLLDAGRPYASFVSAVFDLYGEARGKSLVGDKSPGYVRSIPILHELWPSTRFVHVIRDGRDVCLSAIAWSKADKVFGDFRSWGPDPVTTAALWWERSVRLGREAGAALGHDLYLELSYDDLVAGPEEGCAALCAFLDLPFDPGMLRFHDGRTRRSPGVPSKRQWLPPTPGLRDWRAQMAPGDVERFEAAAGDLIDELGYARGAPSIRSELREHASAVRELFAADIVARGRPLPARWAA